MPTNEIREVYSANNLVDAEQIRCLLAESHIAARIVGASLLSIIGELPVQLSAPRVWVHAADFELAKSLIEDSHNQRRAIAQADWTCPRCAEENAASFDCCWFCTQARESTGE